MAKFEKGRQKIGGRQSGTPNKMTAINREFIIDLLSGQSDKIRAELDSLTGKEYISAVLSLTEYILPKMQRVELKPDTDDRVQHIITIKR